MLGFVTVLARLTALRKKRTTVKDVGLGLLVATLLAGGGLVAPQWCGWLLLLYFTSVQLLAFVENDVFFDFGDLRRLGFREPTIAYRLAYLTHYVARDNFVSNGIALGLGGAVLLASGRGWFAAWVVVTYLANLCLLPSHVYLASRMSGRGRTVYLCLLFTAWLLLLLPLALNGPLPDAWLPLAAPLTAGIVLVHIVAVDYAARRLRGNGLASFGGRRYLAWLAPISPFLFKDVLLLKGMILQRLAMGLSLFSLLAVGSPGSSLPGLALLALGSESLLFGRQEGAYRLLADDNLFDDKVLRADRGVLRRHKLVSLSLDVPITWVVIAGLLLALGQARADQLAAMAGVLLAALVVDAPALYQSTRLARVLRHAVRYSLLGVFVAVTLSGQSLTLLWAYLAIVICVYLPDLMSVYWPKVSFRGRSASAENSSAGVPEGREKTSEVPAVPSVNLVRI
ncbi:MAG: hypothetical protein WAS07_01335 [Micropruina sp.]